MQRSVIKKIWNIFNFSICCNISIGIICCVNTDRDFIPNRNDTF